MRQRIASHAARLIAVDGINDFGLAKRKAAKQLGAPSTEALPNNEEIERELRAYHDLYQQREHNERLSFLRERALEVMHLLERFNPYLTGPVLKGTAARYSGIDLQLFTDDTKEVELFLINQHLSYKAVGRHYSRGSNQPQPLAVLEVDFDHVIVHLYIFHRGDERIVLKNPRDGSNVERAKTSVVTTFVTKSSKAQ